jgi:hypothetical protein
MSEELLGFSQSVNAYAPRNREPHLTGENSDSGLKRPGAGLALRCDGDLRMIRLVAAVLLIYLGAMFAASSYLSAESKPKPSWGIVMP